MTVVRQIVEAQISLSLAKSWQLQSVYNPINHDMYKQVGLANIPGSLCENKKEAFCYYCSIAERKKLMTVSNKAEDTFSKLGLLEESITAIC